MNTMNLKHNKLISVIQVMVIAAPYGLQYFNSLRYEFRKTTSVSKL